MRLMPPQSGALSTHTRGPAHAVRETPLEPKCVSIFLFLLVSLSVFINLIKDKTRTREIYGAAASPLCDTCLSLWAAPSRSGHRCAHSIPIARFRAIFIVLNKCNRINSLPFCLYNRQTLLLNCSPRLSYASAELIPQTVPSSGA